MFCMIDGEHGHSILVQNFYAGEMRQGEVDRSH